MLRNVFAAAATLGMLVCFGACGGGMDAAPTVAADAGAQPVGPSGLPCGLDAVLAQRCRGCHAAPPKFGAPMPLVTWDDLQRPAVSDGARRVHELMLQRVADDARPMPPPPNARLSDDERKALTDWVTAGTPRTTEECEGATAPQPGVTCTPDVSLQAASEYEMPESTTDEYVCWGVDLARDPATHVTAFAPKIDNATIVHHVVVYEAPSSYPPAPAPCSSGSALRWRMVLGWAPGAKALELPADVGFPISKDASNPTHYVVQVHYSNLGRLAGQKDRTSVELCTSPPRKYEADVMAFGSQDFTIPPAPGRGGKYTIDCALQVPPAFSGLHFFAAMPHMHKLGVAMSTTLTPAAGGPEVDLGTMPTFSFESQAWLPIDAVAKSGDTIRTKCSWVNTTGGSVGFGERTDDEMCYSFTMYYPRVQSSLWSWAAPVGGSPVGATCTE